MRIFYILLLVFCFSSCTTNRYVIKHCKPNPNELSFDRINGVYEGSELWNILYKNFSRKNDTTALSGNIETEINFNGTDKITAAVYENGLKKNQITLKAKIYKDYVSIKKRQHLIPLPFIYFKSDVHKTLLYTNSENNLGLCAYESVTLNILVFAGGKTNHFSSDYIKKSN